MSDLTSMTGSEKEAESLTFLQLSLEIQYLIIERVCASAEYAPCFGTQRDGVRYSRTVAGPLHLLAVCRHFYNNFKPIILLYCPSRVRFDIQSTDIASGQGKNVLTQPWGFWEASQVNCPPLISVKEERVYPPVWTCKPDQTLELRAAKTVSSHLRIQNGQRNGWARDCYRQIAPVVRRMDRYLNSPEEFLKFHSKTLERVDGAPYTKSLQQWKTLLPNLQVINFTPVKIFNEGHNSYAHNPSSPFRLSIHQILNGSGDEILAQHAYNWFEEKHMYDDKASDSTHETLFAHLSIIVAVVLNLRHCRPWRREYYRYNFPGDLLVIHVNIMNGVASVRRKEWRKSLNFLPNRVQQEAPGARFPGWDVDTY